MCTSSPTLRKKIHLADIYDRHFEDYLTSKSRKLYLEDRHHEAVNKSRVCRTDKLGIALFACEGCGDVRYVHRSCKHRFCGRCGAAETMRWAKQRLSSLLAMKHHHIIWTLPKSFRHLSKLNDNKLHSLLFRTSAGVIKSWFDTRYGLQPGIISVLHTAGSDLKYHPHVHMIVTRGGRELEHSSNYREIEGNYLCPQKFFGQQLRIRFQQELIKLYDKKELHVSNRIENHSQFVSWLYKVNQDQWVVSIQDALEDPSHIVSYVGRYTKRTCLSEYKILEGGEVIKFEYKDYKNTPRGEQPRIGVRTMMPVPFLDELLQHVPTKGYQMVRYYGTYSSIHLNNIPQSLLAQVKEEEIEFEEGCDWGEFEVYRKSLILSGRPDPLYCTDCDQSLKWKGILLKGNYIDFADYDSS